MVDPRAFAELLCGYCLEVSERQQVLVRSTTLAAPLLLELQRAILERDAWPLLRVELPEQARGFYAHARDRHLDEVPALTLTEAGKADAALAIQAPADTHELAGVDPERLAVRWEISGVATEGQKALLMRFRVATPDERRFVRDALREHLAENFPDLEAP